MKCSHCGGLLMEGWKQLVWVTHTTTSFLNMNKDANLDSFQWNKSFINVRSNKEFQFLLHDFAQEAMSCNY